LAIALARPREDRLSVAAVGDSHIFRIDAEGATELGWQTLGRENPHYLGPEEETWHRPNAALSETPLSGTRCLVLVTDGLSEPGIGVDDPAAVLSAASSEARSVELARRPQWLARRIVELAQESHRRHRSGDNVAAAVLWSETRRR
jgi:serine/threonine protein phosphatase PrpC